MKSSTQRNLVAAAVAVALGSTAAYALPPSATYNYTLYAAGGSAQENAAYWAVEQLLTASTIDVYTESASGAADGTYLIVTGTTNSAGAAALGASGNVLFFYKFGGGSFTNGIFPFTASSGSASQLPYPTIASFQTATATGVTSPATTPAAPTYKFTGVNTNSQSPDWGLSDEEVALFNYPYNLNGVAALSSAQLSNIKSVGIYDDVFGVAVTNALYNGTVAFPHPKTSFTKQEVQGILGGAVQNWNQLFADDGTQLPSAPLWLLDRGSGSGSKAAGNQYFLNYPGGIATGGALQPASVTAGGVNAGYTDTILNLSGGYQDVKEASNAAIVTDLQNANLAGDYAVAILSAEFAPAFNQSSGSVQYSFAKINGVGLDSGIGSDNINGTTATTYSNVVTGAYDFAYQNSFNARTATPTGWTAAIKSALQSPGVSGAAANQKFPNAVTGVLLDPDLAAISAQSGGVILWSRNGSSTAPIQLNFDATTVQSSGGKQVITYGSDPLH